MLSRYIKTFLPVLALATALFASCNGKPPQIHRITVQPNKVEVNQTATLTVNASGQKNLEFKWEAPGGWTLSNSTGQSVTYKAPNTVGTYTITVTATDSGGSTTKSTDVQVVQVVSNGPPSIDLNPVQFRPNPDPQGREELIADIGGGVTGLAPQPGQRGIDLTGYKLEMSLQGDARKNAQLIFKDCKYLNSYRDGLPVGQGLSYDPENDSKAVNQNPDFSHICIVGVRGLPNRQGIRVVSARLVKIR